MAYGISYQGSKNQIAQRVCNVLPSADVFVDVFAGGCAISHCMIEHGKATEFVLNDINVEMPQMFVDGINGKYKDYTKWVSREEFLASTDSFIRRLWSFNNCGVSYLYSKEIEPCKKAFHYAVMFRDRSLFAEFGIELPECDLTEWNDRRLWYSRWIKQNHEEVKNRYKDWYIRTILKRNKEELEALNNKENERLKELEDYFVETFKKSGLRLCDINKHLNNQMAGHYFTHSEWYLPTQEAYEKLKEIMPELDCDTEVNTEYRDALKSIKELQSLQSLQILESLQRLERLENEKLQSVTDRIAVYGLDYEELYEVVKEKYKGKKIVFYCDPPYANTSGYSNTDSRESNKTTFDHSRFYDFVERVAGDGYDIYCSERYMPEERFKCVFEVEKRNLFTRQDCTLTKTFTEKVFIPIYNYVEEKEEAPPLLIGQYRFAMF